jgi:uncharacterized protein YjdB
MSIPSPIHCAKSSAKSRFHRGLPALLALLVACLLSLSLSLVSCHSSDANDVYVLSFKLDSSRVGKFDSVRVDVYNGKAPGPGDTTKPVQSKTFDIGKGTTQVKLELSDKVKKDFSVVVTGFDSTGAPIYRKLNTYQDFNTGDKNPPVLLVSRIDADPLTLSVGETRLPALTLTPADAGDKRVILTSGSPSTVAVVGDSLKGLTAGTATVTVTTADAQVKNSFLVTVTAVRVAEVKSKDLSLKVGDTLSPVVTVSPSNATDKGYGLQSSDSTVVKITGTAAQALRALKAGNAQVIIASADGGAKDTISVDVRLPVKGLSSKDLSKEVGDKFLPDLTFDPADATDRKYVLVSKDTSKVLVKGDSLLAMAAGVDTISATSHDGSFDTKFIVTVAPKFFKVVGVSAADVRGVPGDTLDPVLVWNPLFASNRNFSLVSLDTAKAQITGTRVYLLGLGTAPIEITSADGGLKDTFNVSVEAPAFKTDVLLITSFKCAPCHSPGQTFNWEDSAQLVRKGVTAIARLTRPDTAVGKMPLKGAPNGNLTPQQLSVLLGWLSRYSIGLQSIAVADTTVNLGDTLAPNIVFTPANASNRVFTLNSLDTTSMVVRGLTLVPTAIGQASVDVQTDEGGFKARFKVKIDPPSFQKNVLPITTLKCAPCHVPGQTFNWQDSIALVADGSEALDRLQRNPDAAGKMPLKGAPNGDLTAQELRVVLGWLNTKVVPLKGITVPDDSVLVGKSKSPAIVWDPPGATDKLFILLSLDTNKVSVLGAEFVGKAVGSAQVEVRAVDGNFSKLITVKVLPIKVDSIAVSDTGGTKDSTIFPKVNFFPPNATNQGYTIALLKPSTIVRVDSGNRIVGLVTPGKDTLEATSADGSKKARFSYTVGPVMPISLSIPDTNGVAPNQIAPRLIWNPTTTTDKGYTLAITGDTTLAAVRLGTQILCKAPGTVSVTATSTANSSVKATFAFTVGTVGVASFSIASLTTVRTTTNIGPTISWIPTNATNKTFSLTPDLTKFTVTGGGLTLTADHLVTNSIVTVKSLDSNKVANWTITVVRTPFQTNFNGKNVQGIMNFKCGTCHNATTGASQPNWGDSATVLSFATIMNDRITRPLATSGHMPPSTSPQLQGDTLATIQSWILQN